MAGGEKVVDASKKGPTGHDLMNQGHGDDVGAMAITPGPFTRPGNSPRDDRHARQQEELAGEHENGPRGHGST